MVPVPLASSPAPPLDDAGLLVKDGVGHGLPDRLVGLGAGAGDEQRVAVAHDAAGDGRQLGGRLALPEHDFREALADGPVVIHAGEPQVFERLRPKPVQQVGLDGLERHLAPLQAAEQVVEFLGIHGCAPGVCQ